uniref:C3H1-type domain-containing protein n=1 Tax=viral metagenome TaxID=1070528 RepID=A0A6C0KEK1_9ZZZZ
MSRESQEYNLLMQKAFLIQTNPAIRASHLFCTSICKSVISKSPCLHAKCAFAHTREQLRPNRCPYDMFCHRLGKGCTFYHSNQDCDAYLDGIVNGITFPENKKNEPLNAFTTPCNGKCGDMNACFFAHDIDQLRVTICNTCMQTDDTDCLECPRFHSWENKLSYQARKKLVFPSKQFVINVTALLNEDDIEDDAPLPSLPSLSISQLKK